MKKMWFKMAAFSFALAVLAPVSLMAQKEEKDKEVKEKEKQDVQQIIITRKNNSGEKVVIEVNGDKVTVNGKPIEEYSKDGDISVRTNKFKTMDGLTRMPYSKSFSYDGNNVFNGNNNFDLFTEDANRAMLGVTTEKTEGGAMIEDVTKES